MDVADDGYGCANVDDIGFAHENLLGFLAYFAQESLMEELFSEELLYACVEIKGCHNGSPKS